MVKKSSSSYAACVLDCGDVSPLSKRGRVRGFQGQPIASIPAGNLTLTAKLISKSNRYQTKSDRFFHQTGQAESSPVQLSPAESSSFEKLSFLMPSPLKPHPPLLDAIHTTYPLFQPASPCINLRQPMSTTPLGGYTAPLIFTFPFSFLIC
jgi:hypothetical protein